MAKVTGEQMLFGILSYLGILVLIPLLVKKDDKWVNGHAKQGLMFLIVWVAVGIFTVIPIIGWIIGPILMLILVIVWIIAIIKVLTGAEYQLPIVGKYAASWKI